MTNTTPRYAGAAVGLGGKLIFIGGQVNDNIVATTTCFDPRTLQWQDLNPLPVGRASLAAAVLNGTIYAIGGLANSYLASVEALGAAGTWASAPPMPTARAYLAAAVLQDRIYAAGGVSLSTPGGLTTVEAFDGATWAAVASLAVARKRFSLVAVAGGATGNLLIAGGGGNETNNAIAITEAFAPGAGAKWTALGRLAVGRISCGGGALNGKAYLLGGQDAKGNVLASVEVLNPPVAVLRNT